MISSSLVMYSPVCSYSSHSQLGPSAVGLLGASSSRQYSYTTKYRSVSGVFQNIDPSPPLHPASVSSQRTKGGRVHTRRAVMGKGFNILEDARHWIGLLQYNLSTSYTIRVQVHS